MRHIPEGKAQMLCRDRTGEGREGWMLAGVSESSVTAAAIFRVIPPWLPGCWLHPPLLMFSKAGGI